MYRLITYAKSLIRRAVYIWNEKSTKGLEVEPRVWKERMAVCKSCKHLENNGTYICGLCKCPISDKCVWITETCSDKVNNFWADIMEDPK